MNCFWPSAVIGQAMFLREDHLCASSPGIGGFDDHDVFVEAGRGLGQVVADVLKGAVPVGVIALADDVVVDLVVGEMIEVPAGDGPVAAAIDVDHDPHVVGRNAGLANAASAGGEDPAEAVPLFDIIVRFGRLDGFDRGVVNLHGGKGNGHLRIGPESAAGDFVADLHDLRRAQPFFLKSAIVSAV